MKITIGFDDCMVIAEDDGTGHVFTGREAQEIGTAWYRHVQIRKRA